MPAREDEHAAAACARGTRCIAPSSADAAPRSSIAPTPRSRTPRDEQPRRPTSGAPGRSATRFIGTRLPGFTRPMTMNVFQEAREIAGRAVLAEDLAPSSPVPVRTNSKIGVSSSMVPSSSMPMTSLDRRDLARRRPRGGLCWTTMSMLPAICSRIARDREIEAGHEHERLDARERLAGELACVVVSEPSWPVFIAWSMSSASPPRHSPTTMRSGRMRSAFFTRSRIVILALALRCSRGASRATRRAAA